MFKKLVILIICFSSLVAASQKTITGTVFDEYLEPFPGATISSPSGSTTSNSDGVFTVVVSKLPVNLTITSVGYATENVLVESLNDDLNIILKETYALDQVVISASRTPERVMESPVTIERADNKFIKNTASPNFYEGLKNLKGIDVLDNNYLTKTLVSNRGFANTDNIRFVQLIDGVDSAVPVFQYSLGNVFGVSELDLKSAEILPGAASALYGANAFNGILLMTTKNPFEDSGISAYAKSGITTQEDRGAYGFYDIGFRFAKKVNDKFAVKVNVNYDKGQDWLANDESNINGEGTSHLDGGSNYNGVNVYGDEVSINVVDLAVLADQVAQNPESPLFGTDPLGLIENIDDVENTRISRTGFAEKDLLSYEVNNIKIDASFHFRPWGENKSEIILGSKYSTGNNITQASNRYVQKNSGQQQYKFEIKGNNYFFRAYYSENDAGETYDSKLAGVALGNNLLDNVSYFSEYAGAYFLNLQGNNTNEGAHLAAREYVNSLIPEANSKEFKDALNLAKSTTIAEGGARLWENSGFYNVDANYNFKNEIEFADIQVGGSFRSHALDSKGQIYTDDDGILRYRQYGFYTQLQKKLADDRLKLTATVRYDKSKNFNGNFSPRATLSYAAGEKRNHNFRIGFQTGFRNPSSQDQYSGLLLGNVILLGSVEDNLSREQVTLNWVSDSSQQVTISGVDAFENSFTSKSVELAQNAYRKFLLDNTSPLDLNTLVKAEFELVKPETVRSVELGYRGATNISGSIFEFDLVGYYNRHEDFITTTEVVVPFYGSVDEYFEGTVLDAGFAIANNDFQRFEIATNSNSKINAFGFSTGFNTKIFNDFYLGGSYAFSDFNIETSEDDVDFDPAFNTPKHAVKIQFGNNKLYKNLGFGIDTRWQSEYLYQTRFMERTLPSRFVLDAQCSYNISSIKSSIKIGATNLTGKEYNSVPEAGTIGSQYYISFLYNN